MDPGHSSEERGLANLRRIADALGRPVAFFYRGRWPGEETERRELLLLWDHISNPLGRRRLLSLARQEAARDDHRDDD